MLFPHHSYMLLVISINTWESSAQDVVPSWSKIWLQNASDIIRDQCFLNLVLDRAP